MYLTRSNLLSPFGIIRDNSICTMGSKTQGLNIIVKPLLSLVSSSHNCYLMISCKYPLHSLPLLDIPHTSFFIFPPFCNKVPSAMHSICLLLLALSTGYYVAWNCSWSRIHDEFSAVHYMPCSTSWSRLLVESLTATRTPSYSPNLRVCWASADWFLGRQEKTDWILSTWPRGEPRQELEPKSSCLECSSNAERSMLAMLREHGKVRTQNPGWSAKV